MDSGPLEARVERDESGAIIRLAGRIDRDADATVARAYSSAVELDPSVVTLDFTNTGYINSTGIALIVRLLAEARRERREVRARGLSEHYREIFQITRLSDFMTIEEDVAVASGGTATVGGAGMTGGRDA